MHLKQELENRGFVYQYSDEKVFDIYNKWWEVFYIWFDPSADSLHLWNFCGIMLAINLMKYGNKCYFLSWWATWMIWDPGGKDSERSFLDEQTLTNNTKAISKQLQHIVDHVAKISGKDMEFDFVNNYDFYKDMNFLWFLREVGKYMTVNQMMAKETVKKRIEDPDKSISYTEFSYMLLQGYDFYKLFAEKWIKLQIWWSDQWWNLITWVELIRKKTDKEAYVITLPLLVDSTGRKFWKSEWNAIWLDKNKNSPYFVYQYFINTADSDIERFLKILTLLSFEEISSIVSQHNQAPEQRYWQRQLAKNVIKTIFGDEDADQCEKIAEILFGKEDKLELLKNMSTTDLNALYRETWWAEVQSCENNVLDLCVEAGLSTSKWEAKKLIVEWWLSLNENKITDLNFTTVEKDFISWKVCLLRKGKKIFKLIIKK